MSHNLFQPNQLSQLSQLSHTPSGKGNIFSQILSPLQSLPQGMPNPTMNNSMPPAMDSPNTMIGVGVNTPKNA